MKTMICLILDRSGSMAGRENDVIGGVNSFIEDQKKLPDPASVAFVRFDTGHIERFRPMQDLAKVEPLTRDDFQPRGGTPLLDAVGQTITALDNDWKAEKPDRCIVVIVTDGEENASREYTKDKIQALIKARQDSNMWAFMYLGANVDAFAEAGSMGIMTANSAGYTNTAAGVKRAYAATSDAVIKMRATGSTVAHNLGVANLGEDDDDQSMKVPPIVQPVQAQQPASPKPWMPPSQTAAPSNSAWTPPA
jgi:uncharacterized protein YegL